MELIDKDRTDIQILLSKESLQRSKAGMITGNISFEVNEVIFPFEDWNDCVVIIMSWWSQEILNHLISKNDHIKLSFMDGPYCLNFYKISDNWRVVASEKRKQESESLLGHVDTKQILDSFSSAAELLINETSKRGWVSEELKTLVTNFRSLKNMRNYPWHKP